MNNEARVNRDHNIKGMVKQDNCNSHTMSPGTVFTMLQTNKGFRPPCFIIVHARNENISVMNVKFIFLCEKVLTM
jgi:hypothetical protein